ncbi:acyltransferase [Lactobacillaceae bacterium 24-114]
MTSKRIYTGFDLIKLIAAVGIIAIHTHAPFLNVAGRLGVPFFAIVSGFLFFNHYQQLTNAEEQRSYLRKFCKRIFFLYAIWQVIYIPIAIHQFRVIMASLKGFSVKNLMIYVIDFIFPAVYNAQGVDLTKDANGWGPSWYLLASIVAMPVFIFLLKIFRNHVIPVLLLCLFIEIFIILSDEFGSITHLEPIFNHTFLRLLIYFCLGYILVKYNEQIKAWPQQRSIVFFALLFCLFFAENLLVHFYSGTYTTEEIITTVPTGFMLAVVAINFQPKLTHPVQVRNLSTFLYCFQIWPIVVLEKLLEIVSLKGQYILLFILVMLVSLVAAYIYEWLCKRFNWGFLKYMV